MEAILAYINKSLKTAGINYELYEWKKKVVYPYWVGDYSETPSGNEDGGRVATFTLDGFTRGQYLELERDRQKIEEVFTHNTSILDDLSGVDVSYSGSFIVPTGDAELKRIQINLTIKQWRVI